MKNYTQMREEKFEKPAQTTSKRQEKTLRNFKETLQHIIYLLRKALQAESSYLYWINRSRGQFVLEARSTDKKNIRFQDRADINHHFLKPYKDIKDPVTLKVGRDIDEKSITHYFDEISVEHILLAPFINNDETVAITVLEWDDDVSISEIDEIIFTYVNTLGKLLSTHLEMNDLYKAQQEWVHYEQQLSFLDRPGHEAGLLQQMMETLQSFLNDGSVSLITRGMGIWCTILNTSSGVEYLPVGIPVEKRTVAGDALKKNAPEFAIHFNNNPKRISPRENYTEGASIAIPVAFNKVCNAIVLIHEKNPLLFKESMKHKLKNIVRLTGLKIQARPGSEKNEQLFTNQYDAIIPDFWERVLDTEIRRLKNEDECFNTWAGFAAVANLSEMRSQNRLEDLQCLQKDLIKTLKPSNSGIPGIIGAHSDYMYMVIMQSKDPAALDEWRGRVNDIFSRPFQLSNGKELDITIESGFILLHKNHEDAYDVTQQAKAKL